MSRVEVTIWSLMEGGRSARGATLPPLFQSDGPALLGRGRAWRSGEPRLDAGRLLLYRLFEIANVAGWSVHPTQVMGGAMAMTGVKWGVEESNLPPCALEPPLSHSPPGKAQAAPVPPRQDHASETVAACCSIEYGILSNWSLSSFIVSGSRRESLDRACHSAIAS